MKEKTQSNIPIEKTFEIIPAIDVIDGKCVRLTKGDYNQKKIYADDPLEVAKRFEDVGIGRLHLVDLDGAKKREVVNWKVLEKIASETKLSVDFGGGITAESTVERVFNSGAQFATIGSLAVTNPELFYSWARRFGNDKFMLGADVVNEKIATEGWLRQTDISVTDFLNRNISAGLKNIFCTDISKDGLLKGPSIELYQKIISAIPNINLIASGGISGANDIMDVFNIGCKGVIAGKAIYEGKISLKEIELINSGKIKTCLPNE